MYSLFYLISHSFSPGTDSLDKQIRKHSSQATIPQDSLKTSFLGPPCSELDYSTEGGFRVIKNFDYGLSSTAFESGPTSEYSQWVSLFIYYLLFLTSVALKTRKLIQNYCIFRMLIRNTHHVLFCF